MNTGAVRSPNGRGWTLVVWHQPVFPRCSLCGADHLLERTDQSTLEARAGNRAVGEKLLLSGSSEPGRGGAGAREVGLEAPTPERTS